MAGQFFCSGDHIDTDTGYQKWQQGAFVVPVGKHGRGLSGKWAKSIATIRDRRCTMGAWFRGGIFMGATYHGSTNSLAGVTGGSDGSLVFGVLGGPSYTSAVDLWRPNTWHFVEMDVFLDSTVDGSAGGFVKVYIDDPLHLSPVIDETDVQTASSTYARAPYYWNGCHFEVANGVGVFDDAYCLDGMTTDVYGNPDAPIGPLGPIQIDVIRSTGVGFKAEWDPTPAVPNWQNVDDDVPDGVTLNSASPTGSPSGIGAEDLHEMDDINTGDTAKFMHLLVSAHKTGEGVGQLTMIARHDGVTYDLETRNLAEDPLYRTRVALHTMPNGDPLTDANFNAMQFGYRREA